MLRLKKKVLYCSAVYICEKPNKAIKKEKKKKQSLGENTVQQKKNAVQPI